MAKIKVFDSWETVSDELINYHYEKNLNARRKLMERLEGSVEEYIKVSEISTDTLLGSISNKYRSKQLSKEEYKRFLEAYPDIGDGLKLTQIIHLGAIGGKYFAGQAEDGMQVIMELDKQDKGHRFLRNLVSNIRSAVDKNKLAKNYFGADIDVLFYTIPQELPLFSEEQKQELMGYLKNPEAKKELKDAPFRARIGLRFFSWYFRIANPKIRGLNKKERKKFERLYFGGK